MAASIWNPGSVVTVPTITSNILIGTPTPNADAPIVVSESPTLFSGALPGSEFHHYIGGNATPVNELSETFASSTNILARRAEGPAALPTAVAANSVILNVGVAGYNSAAWTTAFAASLRFTATALWTTISNPTRVDIATTSPAATVETRRLRIDEYGRLSGQNLHNNAQGIAGIVEQYLGSSGNFSPAFSNQSNISSLAAVKINAIRVGNIVQVSFIINVTPTGAGATMFDMTLPVATTSTANNLSGVSTVAGGVTVISVTGNAANVRLAWTAGAGTPVTIGGMYSYEVN